jgi:ABC-type transporter Mla subunit MlaD
MNNPAIEQALIELEESLKQIKSANENVNSVSLKSEQLIIHMNKVIASLNAISANVNIDKEAVNEQLSENNKVLQKGISKLLKDANDKSVEIQNQLQTNQIEFSKELIKITKSAEIQLNGEIENYKKAIRETSNSIEKEITIITDQINNFKSSSLKVDSSLNDLSSRLDDTNFKVEFEKLNRTVLTKNNILIAINIMILLGVFAAILIK